MNHEGTDAEMLVRTEGVSGRSAVPASLRTEQVPEAPQHDSDRKRKRAQQDREYYQANRQRILERNRLYRKKNAAEISAKMKRKRKENPEWQRAHNSKNYQRHKRSIIQRTRDWIAKNKELHNAYTLKTTRRYTRELNDVYVRHKLSQRSILPASTWPDSLVELKRAELQTKRLCRKLQTTTN